MNWWQYLILANLYLGLFYGFYALLLRKETFFQLNRVYLVSSAAISFLLPLIQANWVQKLFITRQVKQVIFNAPVIALQYTGKTETDFLSVGHLIAYAYLAGLLAFAIRFTWQLASLQRLISRHTAGAYSFFKKVQVSGELSEHEVVSAHEHVHARQWHSADVMLIELISIINWFNPVIYLYRNAVKHTHEFIADRLVIDAGADKAGYAMLLLNQTFNAPVHNLVNPFFNHSLLKQRIMMLQKNRSQRVKLLKYGLSAPLFVLMLILSSATINDNKTVLTINRTAEKVLETPVAEVVPRKYIDEPKIQPDTITVENIKIEPKQALKAQVKSLELKLDTVPKGSNEVFTQVEQQPEFPGGLKAFGKYLQTSIKYPAEDVKNKASGKVFVQFIVEEDGALNNVHVIRGISETMNAEAVRVLKASPKWAPGKQNGHPVRVQYTVPIAFNLPSADNAVKDSDKQGTLIPGNGDDEKPATVTIKGEKLKGKVDEVVIYGFAAKDTAKIGRGLTIRGDKSDLKDVTYYLNGKEINDKEMKAIKPNTIKSIDVIKDSSKKPNEKGYGKVMITTK